MDLPAAPLLFRHLSVNYVEPHSLSKPFSNLHFDGHGCRGPYRCIGVKMVTVLRVWTDANFAPPQQQGPPTTVTNSSRCICSVSMNTLHSALVADTWSIEPAWIIIVRPGACSYKPCWRPLSDIVRPSTHLWLSFDLNSYIFCVLQVECFKSVCSVRPAHYHYRLRSPAPNPYPTSSDYSSPSSNSGPPFFSLPPHR